MSLLKKRQRGNDRPWRYLDNTVIIPLTQGYDALVDPSDAYLLTDLHWFARVCDGTVYASANSPREDGRRKPIQMHRMILGITSHLVVDHIDGNGLNNRQSNLRICTRPQNSYNKGPNRNNRLGVKGVTWNSRDKRFIATIHKQGRNYIIGNFKTLEEAKIAYHMASLVIHGEFAWQGTENGVTFHDASRAPKTTQEAHPQPSEADSPSPTERAV